MSSNKVRYAVLTGPRTFEIVHRDRPELKGRGVRIAVEQCGVTGFDVRTWAGGEAGSPEAPGRDVAGRVIEVGPEVRDLKRGDRVAAWLPNGGGFADEVVASECVKVSDRVAFPFAVEPLACVAHCMWKAAVMPDADITVVGAGFQGMLAVRLAQRPRSLVVASSRPEALQHAKQLGATHVSRTRDVAAVVSKATQGRGSDVVYEFTGTQAALDAASRVVRPGGKLVLGGDYRGVAGTSDSLVALGDGQRVLNVRSLCWLGVDIVNGDTEIQREEERARERLRPRVVQVQGPGATPWRGTDGFAELIARAAIVVEKAAVDPGADAVVIGSDPRALATLMLIAAESDPSSLTLVTRDRGLHRVASTLGATVVDPDRLDDTLEVSGAYHFNADVVYEFTGAQEGLDLAHRMVRSDGKLVIAGSYSGPPTRDGRLRLRPDQRVLDLDALNRRGVDLVNGHASRLVQIIEEMQRAAGLLDRGAVDPGPLIRGTFPLDAIGAAFDAADRGIGKVVITPKT